MQQQLDLNQAPVAMEQDLNEMPTVDVPLEMIINPAQGDGLEEEQQIEPVPFQIVKQVQEVVKQIHPVQMAVEQ